MRSFADLRAPTQLDEDMCWHAGRGVTFIVDNASVADIANGLAVLEGTETEKEWVNLMDNFSLLASLGYSPRLPWLGYTVWRPRRYNARADGLCNLALDLWSAVCWEKSDSKADRFIVHSDGARRGSGQYF